MCDPISDRLPGMRDGGACKSSSGSGTPSYGTTAVGSRESLTKLPDDDGDDANYPPADYGWRAWLFLAGSFCLEGFLWGLPFSFGVFKSYYSEHPTFRDQKGIAAIGTTTMGVAYFLAPVILSILQRWPALRTSMSVVGVFIITSALLAASLANSVGYLIVTQGFLHGLGAAMVYNPYIFYLDDWFIKRKGLAYGVFWSGTGVSGAIMPPAMEWALNTYGYQRTLRVWAAVVFVALGTVVLLIGPRRPTPPKTADRHLNLAFAGSMLFWLFQIGNIIEGFGFFIPQIYLPSYATSLGFSNTTAVVSASLLNAATTFGMILTGLMVDRLHVTTVLFISAIGSAVSVFFFWGFAVKEALLYLFAITYGVFAGGYTASWSGSAAEVQKDYPKAEIAVIMGLLTGGRGVGCILSGPLSEELLKISQAPSGLAFAYGTKFRGLIIFTGICMLFGRFGFVGRFGTHARGRKPSKSREEENPLLGD